MLEQSPDPKDEFNDVRNYWATRSINRWAPWALENVVNRDDNLVDGLDLVQDRFFSDEMAFDRIWRNVTLWRLGDYGREWVQLVRAIEVRFSNGRHCALEVEHV